MSNFAWLRREMAWLGHGFIYCVHTDAEDALRRGLDGLGFAIFRISGEAIHDAASLHAELARAFGFPDYYGANWDAFNDCFDDPELPQRSALLWPGAEHLAQRDLKAFAESIAVLREAADALARDERQLELFLLGTGPAFRRPTDPLEPDWPLTT